MARSVRKSQVKEVPLSEVKNDLTRFLHEAETSRATANRPGCSSVLRRRTTGLITGLRTTRGSCSGSSKHAKACAPAEASNCET